jgi:hypothetical protein
MKNTWLQKSTKKQVGWFLRYTIEVDGQTKKFIEFYREENGAVSMLNYMKQLGKLYVKSKDNVGLYPLVDSEIVKAYIS